ncbi:transporter, major facilitator family protein [Leptospira wolbachii serovar Codice str. CDC]|uniref:Transporter, major facilitator family protein n=1 Tax=Leptospira wolbachii serovar Codice str. CDC TaxID=1218599 RepID=R9A3W3_9LEPT|nr:transporter, major facilitator family protein [Leptospira wolbachii serovar Codice str. CDC]
MSYAIGQLGWSTLINIIGLHQVYFYLPPAPKPGQDCFPDLIEKMAFWGLSTIGVVAAVGRLWDAFTDPIIANSSDRFSSRFGRRIPFLFLGGVPAAVFCWLIFVPPHNFVSSTNLVWMTGCMLLFYLFLTVYVTPFFALIPELGHSPEERLNLSTYISVTYALGIIVASTEPMIANVLQSNFVFDTDLSVQTLVSRQYAIGILCVFAAICMYFPVISIHEKTYCESEASSVPFKEAIFLTFKNKNFLYFALSDLCYFLALTILTTGISYYVTVLLELEREFVTQLLTVMLLVSFAFYPVVNWIARKIGKKKTVLFGFYVFLALFLSLYFIGKDELPLPPYIQGYLIVAVAAIPIAILGILPNAILADIAELDSLKTGSKREGLFYAGRTFMQKLGQTLAVLIFSTVILLGLDRETKKNVSPTVTGILAPSVSEPKSESEKNLKGETKISMESTICKVEEVEAGGELGVRLTGPLASAFCLLAIILFGKYKEDETLEEIAKIRGN